MSLLSLFNNHFSSRRFKKTGISAKGEPEGSYVVVLTDELCTYETLNNPTYMENGRPAEASKQRYTLFTFYGKDIAQGDLIEIKQFGAGVDVSSTCDDEYSSSSSSSSFVNSSSSSTEESSSSSDSSSSDSSSSTEDSSSSSSSSSDLFATSEDDSDIDVSTNSNIWMKVQLVDNAAGRRHHLEVILEAVEFSREYTNG